ncbi:MAG: hypothetical protein ABSB94_01195 [Syntrophorhabdales bacterium]|jgi:hypothetical protein
MKAVVIVLLFLCVLVSCSIGPVFIAKNEDEAIITSYQDPALSELSSRHRPLLNDIYRRYKSAGIDFYPNGLGFMDFTDDQGKTLHYLLVEVRPDKISTIGEVQSKPAGRFSEVFEHHFEKNLRHLKAEDVRMDGVDGLAFGVYWPVRDLSKCGDYGGFIEYMTIYFHKDDFVSLIEKRTTLSEAVENAEVVTSLDRKPAKSVRVTEVE